MTENNEINNGLIFEELEPVPRLLMGPGPCDLYPRVLKAMSSTILGQFDPHFTEYMNQVMEEDRRRQANTTITDMRHFSVFN